MVVVTTFSFAKSCSVYSLYAHEGPQHVGNGNSGTVMTYCDRDQALRARQGLGVK